MQCKYFQAFFSLLLFSIAKSKGGKKSAREA